MSEPIKNVFTFFIIIFGFQLYGQNPIQDQHNDPAYLQSISYFEAGRYEAAAVGFRHYLKTGKTTSFLVGADFYLAQIDLKANQNIQPKIQFMNHHKVAPFYVKSLLALGNYHFDLKEYKNVVPYFYRIPPNNLLESVYVNVRFKLAYSLYMDQLYNEALSLFNEVTYYFQDEKYKAHYYAGVIYFNNKDFDKALKQLLLAQKVPEMYKLTAPFIAKIYLNQKQYTEVIAYADEHLGNTEGINLEGKIILNRLAAEASFAQLNYSKAIQYYTQVLLLSKSKGDVALFFNFGYSLEQAGKMEDAADQYKIAALSEDTLGQLAAFRLGQIYIELNQFNTAINAFKIVLESEFSPELKNQSYFLIAKSWFQLHNFEATIDVLNAYLKDYPNNENSIETAQLLADAYLYTSNYKAAIDHLEITQLKTWSLKKTYQMVTLKYAQILFNDKLYDEVKYWLSKSLMNAVDSKFQLMANSLMAECLSAQNKYGLSISYFDQVIASKKVSKEQKSKAYYGLGYAQYNMEQYEIAYQNFSLFLNLNTSKNHVYMNDAVLRAADCLFILKRFDEAILMYRKNKEKVGQEYANYQIANIYYLKNELETAQKMFENFIENYSNSFLADNATFQLGEILIDLEKFELAIANFNYFVDRYDKSALLPNVYEGRAVAYTNKSQWADAVKDYYIILDNYLSHPIANEAILGLQNIRNKGFEIDDFDEYMVKLRTLNPNNASLEFISFEQLKNDYFNQDYEQLIQGINAFRRVYPSTLHNYDLYYFMGDAYYELGQWEAGIAQFEPIISHQQGAYLGRALTKSAKANMSLKRYDQAIDLFLLLNENASSERELGQAQEGLMTAYYASNNVEKALPIAQEMSENITLSESKRNLGNLYLLRIAMNNLEYDKALLLAESLIESTDNQTGAEAAFTMAEIRYKENDYPASIEQCIILLGKYGLYEQWTDKTYLLLVDNYMASGELLQAKATLNSILENTENDVLKIKAEDLLEDITQLEKIVLTEEKDSIDG
jgi:tetratricopeptide (TPR) repeat protein